MLLMSSWNTLTNLPLTSKYILSLQGHTQKTCQPTSLGKGVKKLLPGIGAPSKRRRFQLILNSPQRRCMQMKMLCRVCGILDAGVPVDWQCMVMVAECRQRVRGAVPCTYRGQCFVAAPSSSTTTGMVISAVHAFMNPTRRPPRHQQ